jgi:hypothetical protein
MTITLRQKDLENDNKSLYLDIYENGKRKFEFLSLYLIPEINQETKERNEATLKRAQEIRAERVLHPETIPEKGHLMVVPDIPNDDSPEVIDWIQTYMEWMDGNPEYSKRTVEQTQYLPETHEGVSESQTQTEHHSDDSSIRHGSSHSSLG